MFAHAGNYSLQHAHSWQENFAVNQMGHGQIKKDGEALVAPPGASVEPAQKAKVFGLGSKILVAILLHNFIDMIIAHLALAIAGEDRRIGDVELGSHRENDAVRNVGRVGQKRAQEANSTQLEGEAQARMRMTPRFQQGTVAVIEMKVEGKLLWGWLPNIAAIAASLLGRQKFNWHAQDSFSTGSLI